MAEKCCRCGETSQLYYYCDEAVHSGPWCPECWPEVQCGEKHGEGCATMVHDDDPNLKEQ